MFKSVASNWILNLLQMAVLLVLSPFVLKHLGGEQNGLWATIVSYTGVLSLLILGVPMASVRAIATAAAQKDEDALRRALSTCLGICLFLGASAILVAGLLYLVFEQGVLQGEAGRGLAPQLLSDARLAFGIVGIQVACGFAMRLPYGVLEAFGDFGLRNLVMAGELALRFTLTTLLLSWRAELPVLALVQVGCMLAEFAAALWILRRRHPALSFSLAHFDRAAVRPILGFSVFALLLNVGSLLAFRLDAMVIGSNLPAQSATDFDVGNKFFDPLMQLLIGVGAVIMPLAARLSAAGNTSELGATFLKWSKISLSIVLAVGLYLAVLGPAFVGWWMGPEYEARSGLVLQILMLSFLVYLPVRGVALPILMGLGKPRAPALALLVMGLANLAISLALVRPLGTVGVALGTAIPNLFFAVYVLHLACRELAIPPAHYLSRVVLRCAIGALLPLALLLFLEHGLHVRGFLPLLAAGLASTLVFALTWLFFVLRGDPDLDLLARLRARRAPAHD